MARRVLVHAGLPKTGTTYLQTTLWHNRDVLRRQGFLYPGGQRLDHYAAWQQVRGKRGATGWDALVAELRDWPGTGLVSHEFFSMATPEQARRVVDDLAPAEVHVVVTARSYALQWAAMWQEALKMGHDGGFEAFVDQGGLPGAWGWASQDLPAVLARWADAVGRDRVHLVTVPPPDAPRDLLWTRFREVAGLDDADFRWDAAVPNESLGAAQAALLRRVKPHLSGPLLQGPVRHRWVRRYLGHEVLVPQRGSRFSPRPHQVAVLDERCRQAVAAVRDAGYPVAGDLDELLPRAARSGGAHPDDVGDDELVEVAARAIEQMVRDVRRLTEQRDRWRREALAARRRRPGHLARRLAGALGGRRPAPDEETA